MTKIKAIIIDDEKMARKLLNGLLERYCLDIEVVEQCADLPSCVKAITKYKPDLVFLDIEMPGHSGLELLDFFDKNSITFRIIFTTAYSQYAIQAFKLSAIDYLLKPIESEDLIVAVEQFKKQTQKANYSILQSNLSAHKDNQKLAVHSMQSTKFIELKDLLFCKADCAYTDFYMLDGHKFKASKGLKYYEDLLSDNKNFQRCHKSYIVNLTHVSEHVKTDGGHLVVNREHNVPIASDRSQYILHKLKEFSSIIS